MNDRKVIYLDDAIDAVKKNTFRLTFAEEKNCEGHVAWSAYAVYSDVIEGALLELPSAQPKIIHCQGCKYAKENQGKLWICTHPDNNAWHITKEFYCGRAERREE